MGNHTLTVKECLFSVYRETGRATFRLSTLGQGSNSSREVSFTTFMDQINVSGEAAVEPVTLDMECVVFNGSACTADPLNAGQTQTMTAWAASPSAFFKFTSPTVGATGSDLLSWYDFEGSVNASDETVSTGSNGFRCDSASYLNYPRGCAFDLGPRALVRPEHQQPRGE
ncbi:hypothetical protein P3L51_09020 [Streptomyces sp. PSRA5]|uniref:hypothetical protein n=1 Tax=Streptomyces panacea TaxID=3035064 RepID=UPI00339C3A29